MLRFYSFFPCFLQRHQGVDFHDIHLPPARKKQTDRAKQGIAKIEKKNYFCGIKKKLPMGLSKTRQMLVDVARQLFAREGKDNVTMNDIATASQKGRRTLYTYFQNKNAIYLAVIEKEISLLKEKVQQVFDKDIAPDQKLIEYIFTHLEAAREALSRNGSLRADFFRDIYEVEHARRHIDLWETDQIEQIVSDGIRQGIFSSQNAHLSALLIFYALKGVEQAYFRDRNARLIDANRQEIIRVIFDGLKLK